MPTNTTNKPTLEVSRPAPSDAPTARKNMLLARIMHAIIRRNAEKLEDIVKLGFERGDFDHEDANTTPPNLLGKDLAQETQASQMSADEIAVAFRQNIDPYTISKDGTAPKVFEQLPLQELAAALMLPAMFPDTFTEGTRPPSHVTLLRPANADAQDHQAIAKSIKRVLRFFADALGPDEDLERHLQICTYDVSNEPRKSGSFESFHNTIDSAIRQGRAVIAIATQPADLSISGQRLIVRDLEWPPLSQETVINILRVTHSVTGEVAEDELHARLPPDRDLALMPWPLVHHAFRGQTTLDVTDRLRALEIMPAPVVTEAGLTLSDVCGLPNLVRELTHIVDDVAAWKEGKLDWPDISSSVLLFGPPGTGKTMSAEALAGSMNAHFVQTSYADCQKAGHMGDYLKALDGHVKDAINNAPSVFFIDELDSYGKRSARTTRSDRYMHSVVNGLLETLTKLNDAEGVIVIAATNHLDEIDEALIRAGRFDQKLAIGFPDKQGAADILMSHLKCPDIDFTDLSDRLMGLSGADLAAIARAAKGQARRLRTPLNEAHITSALDQIAPPPSSDNLTRKAWHEAGHVVANHVLELPPTDRVFISSNGGGTYYERPNMITRRRAEQLLTVHMAGRAAEIVALGDASNGAGGDTASDLGQATGLALAIETELGLGKELIYAPVKPDNWDKISKSLRRRVTAHLNQAQATAVDILTAHYDQMEQVADALMLHRELGKTEVLSLLSIKDGAPSSSSQTASSAGAKPSGTSIYKSKWIECYR